MALEIWWGSGSPYSWRALLALEYKQLSYVSHLVQFAKQEHKAPALLKMNPRGRVPVLKDGDYVCFESLAILQYLDRKYPQPPLFGHTAEEAGTMGIPVNTLRSQMHRARQRHAAIIRELVAETVSSPLEVEDELRHLLRIMSA